MKNVILYDTDGSAEITGLGIIGADCRAAAKLIGAPVESGQTTFDHKVIEPRTVTLKCLIRHENYGTVRAKIEEMLANREFKFYKVMLKDGGIRDSLALESTSFPDDVNKLDVITYDLSFKEIIVQGRAMKTKDPSDQKMMA